MATTTTCDGCDRKEDRNEEFDTVSIYVGTEAGASLTLDLCDTCKARVLREADARQWPRQARGA